jgi:esterase/lipase
MPGLAADKAIFDYIQLPNDIFELHYLSWKIPKSNKQSLKEYLKELVKDIKHKNAVLIGVSFGGIIVQEMRKYYNARQIIIISSVKHENELPKRLKFVRNTKAYKLTPISVLTNIENFAKYAFGDFAKQRVELYKKYLSVRDKTYLQWAIYNVLHWKQTMDYSDVIHIHGDSDTIFPITNISNSIIVKNGTHVMILNKAKKISQILQEVITFDKK